MSKLSCSMYSMSELEDILLSLSSLRFGVGSLLLNARINAVLAILSICIGYGLLYYPILVHFHTCGNGRALAVWNATFI